MACDRLKTIVSCAYTESFISYFYEGNNPLFW